MTPDTSPEPAAPTETPAARPLPARRLVALQGGDAVELVRAEDGVTLVDPETDTRFWRDALTGAIRWARTTWADDGVQRRSHGKALTLRRAVIESRAG